MSGRSTPMFRSTPPEAATAKSPVRQHGRVSSMFHPAVLLPSVTTLPGVLLTVAGSRAWELARLLQFKPTADGSSFGAAVLAAAAASG